MEDFEFECKENRLGRTLVILRDGTDVPFRVIEGGTPRLLETLDLRTLFFFFSLGSSVTVVSWLPFLSWLCLFNKFYLSLRFEVAQSKLS